MTTLPLSLDRAHEIIITSDLAQRPDRPADLKREAAAFRGLSEAIVVDPAKAVQQFLDVAMELCGADAAGLSIPDDSPQNPLFRWDALTGVYAGFVGGTVPRDDSPCGLARIRNQSIIVSRPGKVFPEFAQVDPAIEEGMIIPFYDNGLVFMGTIWVVHTKPEGQFCSNDLRIMEQLAVQLVLALKLLREQDGRNDIRLLLDGAQGEGDFGGLKRDLLPATAKGEARIAGALHADIAKLIEASAFLSSILGSSNDCIKVLNLNGRIEFVNDNGIELLAAPDMATMRKRRWQDAWTGIEQDQATQALEAARRGEPARFHGMSPTFTGEEKYWDVQLTPIRHNGDGISHILAISRDVTAHKRIEQQREILAGELDHRVKNILAMVVAIAHQTLREPATLETASKAFIARMTALGDAQSILVRSSWDSADIGVVVSGAIAPHRSEQSDSRIVLSGPELQLSPSKALALALAIHELSTNAAKYGSLSNDTGTVLIEWTVCEETFQLIWAEGGGPPVVQPTRRGFGTRLLERALASEFQGRVGIEYASSGVRLTLVAPLAGITNLATA